LAKPLDHVATAGQRQEAVVTAYNEPPRPNQNVEAVDDGVWLMAIPELHPLPAISKLADVGLERPVCGFSDTSNQIILVGHEVTS